MKNYKINFAKICNYFPTAGFKINTKKFYLKQSAQREIRLAIISIIKLVLLKIIFVQITKANFYKLNKKKKIHKIFCGSKRVLFATMKSQSVYLSFIDLVFETKISLKCNKLYRCTKFISENFLSTFVSTD